MIERKGLATPEQRARLKTLIDYVLAEDSQSERDETLVVACSDPRAAFESFRALARHKKDMAQ